MYEKYFLKKYCFSKKKLTLHCLLQYLNDIIYKKYNYIDKIIDLVIFYKNNLFIFV